MRKINIIIKEEIRKFLLEVTEEQAKARFDSKSFNKAVYKDWDRRGAQLPLEDTKDSRKRFLMNCIPTDINKQSKADALWWAISTYINTGTIRNLTKTRGLIETFFQIKEAGKGSILAKPDINQIQSWDELEEVVTQAKPAWEEYKQSKASKDWEAGSNLIFEDDTWQVFIPENKGAACKLGKGTEWCTAAPGLDYYEQYHSPEDPLIIFINKQDPTDKYQFHYKTSQFMDKNDRSIKENPLFYKLNQIVKSLTDKLPEQVIKKADQWSYEELPDGGYKVSVPNEIKYYNKDGQPHRLDGPAIVWPRQGIEQWYKDGQRHRVGGPAYEGPPNAAGERATAWWQDGQLHRLDGPAREWPNVPGGPGGAKEWWIEGRPYGTEDAFNQHPKVKELKAQQNLREHFMRFM